MEKRRILTFTTLLRLVSVCGALLVGAETQALDVAPWLRPGHAIVIDAYEMNIIDWDAMAGDKKIAAFISKASDGLPESFDCKGAHRGDTLNHCKTMWRKYAVSRELYQARRLIARSRGLLWGAYHLARPGNPIDQANHFLDYAKPRADELMVLDLEGIDAEKYMSLADAAIFAGHIKSRTGRYPMLYTNHATAKHIAANRADHRLLSRLPLWYARYKPGIRNVFPMGNWENYALWQFSSGSNCGKRRCPYRVPGTLTDIDVNVAPLDASALKAVWAKGDLLPEKPLEFPLMIASGRGQISAGAGIGVDMTLTASIRRPVTKASASRHAIPIHTERSPWRAEYRRP
ncbi:glycoside hydrolase family 25 protein [Pararhizobium antarcticum]|uniref:Lysozyme n=1 Tax=Pararhizobium antarcticum TaxID=1798805 RepID=A0A657LP91_9HYPH|nr:GH25 family lysozyme [Pararhizobium antarcticum]OJF93992.1 lysozyme [Pararhizobium antarcticum]OJF97514.1 lysozyme [Rhizobium sp. 58]